MDVDAGQRPGSRKLFTSTQRPWATALLHTRHVCNNADRGVSHHDMPQSLPPDASCGSLREWLLSTHVVIRVGRRARKQTLIDKVAQSLAIAAASLSSRST